MSGAGHLTEYQDIFRKARYEEIAKTLFPNRAAAKVLIVATAYVLAGGAWYLNR